MKTELEKPAWWKPPIESKGSSCACCGSTAEILSLDTKLYSGYGGWSVMKNGALYFSENQSVEFDDSKDLQHVENMIGEDSENEYTAVLFLALRGATYQRHSKDHWVLIETNEGFA